MRKWIVGICSSPDMARIFVLVWKFGGGRFERWRELGFPMPFSLTCEHIYYSNLLWVSHMIHGWWGDGISSTGVFPALSSCPQLTIFSGNKSHNADISLSYVVEALSSVLCTCKSHIALVMLLYNPGRWWWVTIRKHFFLSIFDLYVVNLCQSVTQVLRTVWGFQDGTYFYFFIFSMWPVLYGSLYWVDWL